MSTPWSAELWRIAGFLLLAVIAGLASGHLGLALFVVAAGYLAWHLINIGRLLKWLHGRGGEPEELPGIWGTVFDELYRMRQRNRRRRRRMSQLLARYRESTGAMPDATAVLGPRGELEWWNAAATDLLRLRAPGDTGQRISNLVRHPQFTRYFARGDFSEPVLFPAPVDATRTLSAVIIPYGNQQQLLLARDVTTQMQIEQMRRDFVANVSHELRTPLTVVAGFLETLRDSEDDALQAEWGRTLELMQQQTVRMQHLVEDLLLLSRLESSAAARQESVAVPEMLAGIRENAVLLSGEKAHVITLEAEPGLYVRGSGRELDSAFSNIVNNAVRYTPAGGRVEIRWYADAAGAHLAVRDTGIGIAARHIPRLTERFYRVDVGRSRESGGTGLGLAIVKHVLKRHGAELRIDSRVGEGSVFTCDFPPERLVRQAGRDAAAALPRAEAHDGAGS